MAIGGQILDRAGGDAGVHRGFRDGGRHDPDQARVKGFGDQVVGAEGQLFALIGGGSLGGGGGTGKRCNPVDTGDLHLVIDGGCPHIQRTAEDKGKAQYVVDLIGKIRPARCDNRIRSHRTGQIGHDFRRGVGQRKDDRLRRHFLHHFGAQDTGTREPEEQVGIMDHVGQITQVGFLRVFRFDRVHVDLAALVDQTVNVTKPDVLALHAEFQQHVQTSDARRAAACGDDLDVLELLARHEKCVLHGGANDNRGAVLVVVENRNVHPLAADAFDGKAIGGLDVFEVDRAEGRL